MIMRFSGRIREDNNCDRETLQKEEIERSHPHKSDRSETKNEIDVNLHRQSWRKHRWRNVEINDAHHLRRRDRTETEEQKERERTRGLWIWG